jgi:hypothetical protein
MGSSSFGMPAMFIAKVASNRACTMSPLAASAST